MAVLGSSMPRTADVYKAKEEIEHLKLRRSRGLSPEAREEREQVLKKAIQSRNKLQRRMNLSQLLGSLVVISAVLAIVRALPEGMTSPLAQHSPVAGILGSFAWLLQAPEAAKGLSGDFAALLAPFMAVSFAIERVLETGFNWFEHSSRVLADVLVAPRESLDWIGREYQEAYEATKDAAMAIGIETNPERLEIMNAAEERLAKAEARLRSWMNAPEYIVWKKALSIWFGLLVGLMIAVIGDLGMLRYIGITTPRIVDMMVTGLLLGAGPGPMHDLIGMLQSSKEVIGSLAELAKGKAVREAAEALQRETDALQKQQRRRDSH